MKKIPFSPCSAFSFRTFCSCSVMLASLPAFAQGASFAIEEVIVTAERRESNLQTVPIAVSSFSEQELEARQVDNIGDLQALVPNLSVHVGDANNAVVYIRGVGQIDSIAFFEPGVGIYLDDVYLGRAQGAFLDVVDVERIEVLRGPQGSLYGRNTVGGALKYVSASPTDELSGNLSATLGNYGRTDVKGTISGPIIDDVLTGRLTLAKLKRDGYSDNAFDGEDDGDQNTSFLRSVLRYTPSETVSVQWAFDYTDSNPNHSRTPAKETPINLLVIDPYTFGASIDSYPADQDPFKVNADFNQLEETEAKGTDLNIAWDVTDQLTFKSITSYRELDYRTELDLDGTPRNAFGIFYYNDQEQFSQEFQLNYHSDRLSAVGGLFYYNEESATFDGGVFNNFLIASSGTSESSTESYAIFGQLDYDFTEQLTATFGFRYTEEEKDYERLAENFDLTALAGIMFDPLTGAVGYSNPELLSPRSTDLKLGGGIGVPMPIADPDAANFDNFSPKLGLKYQLSDDAQVYATLSTGFKSGGFNGRVADAQLEPYDEETLTSFELGYKSQWMDDKLRLNAAAFYNEYDDLQVSSFETTADGNSILPVFSNAGEAVIQGIELELTLRVTEAFTLNANVGYLDAEYKEYFAAADPVTNTIVDVSDEREMVNAPEWDTFLGATYMLPVADWGQLTFMGDVSYRSKTYLEVNSSENLAQDGYSVVNAGVMLEPLDGNWMVLLGGKNLTDEEYRTHAFDLSAFPGVELGYYNAPLTYSVTARYSF
ncbi:MAG: iron complex outermembrane receptor protein [Halioglobus sp.]|jgi:iron complex outermembrane receptor protein